MSVEEQRDSSGLVYKAVKPSDLAWCKALLTVFRSTRHPRSSCEGVEYADLVDVIVTAVGLVWNVKLDEMRQLERFVAEEEFHGLGGFVRRIPKLGTVEQHDIGKRFIKEFNELVQCSGQDARLGKLQSMPHRWTVGSCTRTCRRRAGLRRTGPRAGKGPLSAVPYST